MPLPQIICFGEALTDLIRTGENQWLSRPGGAPWNVARVLAVLGVHSAFGGAISTDHFGDELWLASEAAGLDLRFIQRIARPPLMAVVHSLQPPQYFFMGDYAADLYFDPELLPTAWDSQLNWAHFGGISLTRPPLAARLVDLAKQLKLQGAHISFDPNFRQGMDEHYDPVLRQMCELADVIKVSDEDLGGLFRHSDQGAALASLRSFNPKALLLYTRGAEGACLLQGEQAWHASPPPLHIIDTIGAGDAAMGGLLFSLSRAPGANPAQHLQYAVAAGSAACAMQGAAAPSGTQIDTILQQVQVHPRLNHPREFAL